MAKEKVTVELSTKEIVKQRAAEDGMTMGAYLDRLVERDDWERRVAADVATMRAAGLLSPQRLVRQDVIAAAAVRSRRAAS